MTFKSISLKAAGIIAAVVIMMMLVIPGSPAKAADFQVPAVTEHSLSTELQATAVTIADFGKAVLPKLQDIHPEKYLSARVEGTVAHQFVRLTDTITKSYDLCAKCQKLSEHAAARILAAVTAAATAFGILTAMYLKELKSI